MNLSFEGRVVAVTGAGYGLGQTIAETFAGLGARVFGCGPAASSMTEIDFAVVNLTDRKAAAAWVREVEGKAGQPIDVLVNNAGGVAGQVFRPIEEISDEDWDRIIAVNLGAAFAVTRAAVPGMKRAGRGRIINISSGAGLQPSLTGIQAYCSAKHGVVGFTKQLAHELGQFGITVNSVAPGLIPSNPTSTAQWESYGEAKQTAMVQAIPMRRLGTAQEIANSVVFFASPLADFVNGQIISVSGGR